MTAAEEPRRHADTQAGASASRVRVVVPIGLLASGLLLSAVALLDPLRPAGILLGPLVAASGLVFGARFSRPRARAAAKLACALALSWSAGALARPEFRADAFEFFVYLPSLAFDHDLSLHDDWLQMGFDESPPLTATGVTRNRHAIGPALAWAPFYALAHAYVVADGAWGSGRYEADGHSNPYRRATALGTIALALAGSVLLARVLARRFDGGVVCLALGTALAASPILYYVFVAPAMSHGATFGIAAALLWACDHARREPSTRAWLAVGALVGLLAIVRWQAAVYVLLVAPVALDALRRGTLRLRAAVAAAAVALAVFSPQMLAWRALFGRVLTMPQGGGFLDWSSPHWLDTLISADHGLLTWTPALLLGLVGLVAGARREPWLHAPALLIVAASAWVNGGADDWAGSEAFGARRFDLVVPLLAVGLAVVLDALRRAVARRPLLAPAALVALLVLWNLGLVALFRDTRYSGPLRLERVAADQALLARRSAEDALAVLFGARGRALAYKLFAADYLDTPARPGGRIVLARAEDADLSGRWSAPRRLAGGPAFRFAYPPEACLLVPLAEPRELRATLTVRPARLARDVRVRVNATEVGAFHLDGAWQKVDVLLPERALFPGPNWLCFAFSRRPEEGDDEPAAAVAAFEGP